VVPVNTSNLSETFLEAQATGGLLVNLHAVEDLRLDGIEVAEPWVKRLKLRATEGGLGERVEVQQVGVAERQVGEQVSESKSKVTKSNWDQK